MTVITSANSCPGWAGTGVIVCVTARSLTLVTMKPFVLSASPADVRMATGPVVALAGTTACMRMELVRPKVEGTPLNLTALTSSKPDPVMVTLVPTGPNAGEKPAIRGRTRNRSVVPTMPAGVVTLIGPLVASCGIVALISALVVTSNEAGAPSNFTARAPRRFAPRMVTVSPATPLLGEKPVICGGK